LAAFVMFFEWTTGPPWSDDAFDASEASAFVSQDETVLWLVMLSAQTGLWLLLFYPAFSLERELKADGADSFKGAWIGILLMLIIAGGFVAVAASVHGVHALPGFLPKFIVLTVLGFATCVFAVVGLWRIRGALGEPPGGADSTNTGNVPAQGGSAGKNDSARQEDLPLCKLARFDRSPAPTPIGGLLRLHELLHRALLVLGTVLAAGILATGALRNALITWDNRDMPGAVDDDAFPLEHLLAYGIFFSALLALIYVPVYTYYLRAGQRVLQRYAKLPGAGDPNWSTAIEQRNQLRDLLHLDVTPTANFQAGVAILAPLTSSLLAVLLPSE
jgi:hypothetical protein